jgi:hypothetical protein
MIGCVAHCGKNKDGSAIKIIPYNSGNMADSIGIRNRTAAKFHYYHTLDGIKKKKYMQ